MTLSNSSHKSSTSNKAFVVVLRGHSAAIFRQDTNIQITEFPSPSGPVKIVYRTRWLKRDQELTLPGHLWIEISGSGHSLAEVLVPFANAGSAMLPILALSTNVAIGEPEIEIGFENTVGATEREYFQSYVPPETGVLHVCRHVNVEATVAVIRAFDAHADSERLRRGTNQYRLALDSWRLGREALALAHLWMALEAITKAKIRFECSARGLIKPEELAESLEIPLTELDSTVRRELILEGDEECYSKARKASDGFEHGYLDFSAIISRAKDVRHRMAYYIRKAILEMLNLEKPVYDALMADPFDKPLGYWPVVKYLRGKLIGCGDILAADGNTYPFLRWKPKVKATTTTEDGKFNIQFTESMTAELAKGISFKRESFEAWQAD